jgi:hypothetical protein
MGRKRIDEEREVTSDSTKNSQIRLRQLFTHQLSQAMSRSLPQLLYASFDQHGTLDITATLLTITERFEKLEKWTVGHVRALEERMVDVERWLVQKEEEREEAAANAAAGSGRHSAKRFEKIERRTVRPVPALEERMADVEQWLVEKEQGKDNSGAATRTPGMSSSHALCSESQGLGDGLDSDDEKMSVASTFTMHTPTMSSLPASPRASMQTLEMPTMNAVNSFPSATASSAIPPSLGLTTQQRQVFHLHNIQWNELDNLKALSWDSFPWPVFNKLNKVEDLNHDEVKMYLRLLHQSGSGGASGLSKEDCLREHYRRWHPDRLEAKVLNKVYERDREKVRMCAKEITRILEEVMQEGLA